MFLRSFLVSNIRFCVALILRRKLKERQERGEKAPAVGVVSRARGLERGQVIRKRWEVSSSPTYLINLALGLRKDCG